MAGYSWNKDFRQRIIALCLRPDWFARYGAGLILPEYFETDVEQRTVKAILDFYKQYSRVPDHDELCVAVSESDEEVQLVDDVLDCLKEGDLQFASDLAIQFAREQAMKLAVLAGVEHIKHGSLSAIEGLVRAALAVGNDQQDMGLDLKHNLSWVHTEANEHKVQTGIFHVDMMLEGGLGPGELGVILGSTNVGKTRALVNIGAGAASIMGACNVAHVTLELSAAKTAKRYGARTVHHWVDKDQPGLYADEFEHMASRYMPGNIYIKEYPPRTASVQDIDNYIDRMHMLGIDIDMLIVDYPGLMRHSLDRAEGWEVLARTYDELRALGIRWHIPVWCGAQSRREALGKEIVTVDDMGESFKAAQNSDVVLAVCQTRIEADAEVPIQRFYAAKVRDGEAGWMVRCFLDKDSHAVISEGIITVAELIEARKKRKKAEESED